MTTKRFAPAPISPASNNGSLPNNGCVLANTMHDDGLLKDGMSIEEVEKAAISTYGDHRWFKNDDYREDFLYQAFELNYKLKI